MLVGWLWSNQTAVGQCLILVINHRMLDSLQNQYLCNKLTIISGDKFILIGEKIILELSVFRRLDFKRIHKDNYSLCYLTLNSIIYWKTFTRNTKNLSKIKWTFPANGFSNCALYFIIIITPQYENWGNFSSTAY